MSSSFVLPRARSTGAAVLIAALLSLGAVHPVAPGAPSIARAAGAAGTIVVERVNDGGSHLVTMNADGSDARILTTAPDGARELKPRLSPDGGVIAFGRQIPNGPDSTEDHVWLIRADGSGLHQLTECRDTLPDSVDRGCGFSDPAFTPDGQFVVMDHGWQIGLGEAIYRVRLDGSELRHITEEPPRAHQEGPGDHEPTVSPDGRWIASARGGIDGFQIAVVNAHGGDRRLITPLELGAEQPRWSPDGRTIVFRATTDGTFNVMAIGADGSGLRQLTFDTAETGASSQPVFSPDGRQVLFVHRDDDGRDLWLMNADGSDAHRLAATPGELEFSPDWRAVP